jgi:hypothetical protein
MLRFTVRRAAESETTLEGTEEEKRRKNDRARAGKRRSPAPRITLKA